MKCHRASTMLLLAAFLLLAGVSESKATRLWRSEVLQPAAIQDPGTGPQVQEGVARSPVEGQTLEWRFETLYHPTADIGEYPSLALDRDGRPHISFRDRTNNRLYYGYRDQAGEWHSVAFDPSEGEGKYSSLALDGSGRAHISYYDRGSLAYVHQNASGQFGPSELVTGGVRDNYGDLALRGSDNPFFSYNCGLGLRVSYKGSHYPPYFSHQTLDGSSFQAGEDSSMKLDSHGYPHISYYDEASHDLKYVAHDANGWRSPVVVDADGYVGAHTSLALDRYGNPHISYWDWGNGWLKYAYRDMAGVWHREIVDACGTAGEYSSIAIDSNGTPHISYYDHVSAYDGDLKYAFRTPQGAWAIAVVDWEGDVGIDTSLALDAAGNPHIAYYDGTGDRLKYARLEGARDDWAGNTACAWGSNDCNPCVRNVVQSFNSLVQNGEVLGFHLGDHPDPGWTGNLEYQKHWQGMQRIMAGDGRYMVVTHDDAYGWSAFALVHMGSRDGAPGERFRSNRLAWGVGIADTAPPANDLVVGTGWISNDQPHPGGIQVMGDILAVGTGNTVRFYDLADPLPDGQPGEALGELDRGDKTGSTTSLAQLYDGSFLLAVSTSDAKSLDFYTADFIGSGFQHFYEWEPSGDDLVSDDRFFYDWDAFQSLNFVTDCSNGRLYLVGTSNLNKTASSIWIPYQWPWTWGEVKYWPDGQEWASLYEVRKEADRVILTKVAEREFDCRIAWQAGRKKQCNFDAAAGVYVDPNHQLYLYATEHASGGPGNTVKLTEFRPRVHGSCSTPQDAWVQLYSDLGPSAFSWNLMIDWRDRDLENYDNYDEVYDTVEGYAEVARSVDYCLPEDWTFHLYAADYSSGSANPCGGRRLSLTGDGWFHTAMLRDSAFANKAYCSRFYYDPPRIEIYDSDLGITIVYYPPSGSTAQAALGRAQTATADPILTVEVPPLAIAEPATVTLDYVSPPAHDTSPHGFTGYGFNLKVEGADAVEETFLFARPVEVTIRYAADDLSGMDEATLALCYWDRAAGAWIDAAATCPAGSLSPRSVGAASYRASVCRIGEYALLADVLPLRVLIDEAHNNLLTLSAARAQEIADSRPWDAEPDWFFLGDLKAALAAEFTLARNQAPLTEGLLGGYQVLVIPNYEDAALTPEEVSAVRNYVAHGGGLVLLGDAAFYAPNPELAAAYGMRFDPHGLFAPSAGPDLEGEIVIPYTPAHPAAGASTITINWGQSLAVSGLAEPFLKTPEDTWRDDNNNGQYDEGEDGSGEFAVGAAHDSGCGRVVAFADNTFADADLSWTDNEETMAAILRWVAGGRPCRPDQQLSPLPVLVDEGHDNQLSLDWQRASELAGQGAAPEERYLGELRRLLSAEFTLETFPGPALMADLLAAYEALVVPSYYGAYAANELNALQNYVQQGGGLIVLGTSGWQIPDPKMTAAYGVGLEPHSLYAPTPERDGVLRLGTRLDQPALTGKLDWTMVWGQPLSVAGDAEWLANTYPHDTWADLDDDGAYGAGEEGVFDVAAAYDEGCGRVVVLGDDAFSDADLAWTENEPVLRSLLRWVTGGQHCDLQCYALDVTVDPPVGGQVTVDPPPNCSGSQYTQGALVTLTAAPNAGHAFDRWSGDASGSNPVLVLTMDADKGVTAHFRGAGLARILVDERHDNQLSLDWARAQKIDAEWPWREGPAWFHLGDLKRTLSDEFDLVRDPGSAWTAGYLAQYDAVIVPQYGATIAPSEVAALQRYVSGGGGLILLGDCGFTPPNPELAAPYAIEFDARCLFAPYDPQQDLVGDLEITHFAPHPAVEGATSYHQHWGQSFALNDDIQWLATTLNAGAWRDDNGNGQPDPGESNVYDVIVGSTGPCGRVAAVAAGTFYDLALEEWPQNGQLMRALLRWATRGPACSFDVYLPLVIKR
jgi:hypothetical protein